MVKSFKNIVLVLFVVVSFLSFDKVLAASTLTLSSEIQSANIGQEFSVSLDLNTGDENINAAQGVVSFTPSVLQMISVDNSGSVFNFWVEDPTISNDVGTMSFIGGTPKSVSGEKKKILVMKFKAVGIGNSALKISNAVVAADDGLGTNVLSVVNETSVAVSGTVVSSAGVAAAPVTEAPKAIVRAPVEVSNFPSAPKLAISLYPDKEKWYSQIGEVVVFWDLPKDVISVAVSADKNPGGAPVVFEKQLFDGKNIGVLKEGVNYVHVRFKNNVGNGPVSHYKIALDTTPPLDFKVEIEDGLKTDNPAPTLNFSTQDSLSGISFYSLIVDRQAPIKTQSDSLKLSLLEPGNHSVLVKAFDKAGNSTDASIVFEILPIASPEIKFVTQPYFSDTDNTLLVRGSALPNSLVLISVVNSDGTASARASVRSDESGQWEYSFTETLKNGKYKIVVRAQDDRGALSLPVEFVDMVVKSKPIFKIGFFELNLWGVIILLTALLAGSFVGGYYFFKAKTEKVSRKIFITKQDVTKVTDMIKKDLIDLQKAIKTSDKFDDEFVIAKLEEDIAKIDKYVQKEVESIGK